MSPRTETAMHALGLEYLRNDEDLRLRNLREREGGKNGESIS
jgi:hypothetical protein